MCKEKAKVQVRHIKWPKRESLKSFQNHVDRKIRNNEVYPLFILQIEIQEVIQSIKPMLDGHQNNLDLALIHSKFIL